MPGLIATLPRGVTLWHGLDDMILLSEGTRFTVQNMTWGPPGGELQGFQSEPTKKLEFEGVDYGVQHTERGLTYYEVTPRPAFHSSMALANMHPNFQVIGAGHMIPGDQPAVSLEVFKTVLGKGGNFVTSSISGSSSNTNDSSTDNGGGGDKDGVAQSHISVMAVTCVVAAAVLVL